jgi:enoyl-CoA hydratase/carnithine racemase
MIGEGRGKRGVGGVVPAKQERPGTRVRDARVAISQRGHLAEIVLDLRSSGGRLTPEAAQSLAEACERCDDDDVWVVLLRSPGRDFCVGMDADDAAVPDFVAALASIRQPVVASVRGRAEAEGFELALAADLRVVESQTRFRLPQVARGALPAFGATQRLPRTIGVERALRVILLGEAVEGRTALDWGLASRIAQSADRDARALATELLERGPIALRFAKEAVTRAADLTLDDGARFEHDLYVLLETTRDRAEGVRSFLEKRKPIFRGD